jgi:hypothetical protein
MRGLRRIGYEFIIRFDTLVPMEVDDVMQLLDAQALQVWDDIYICPRTCPSSNATLCTYHQWFAGPDYLRRPCQLLQQPFECLLLAVTFEVQDGLS